MLQIQSKIYEIILVFITNSTSCSSHRSNDLPKDYRAVHKMPLQSIGKYKLPELKGFAVEYDIPLQKNGKNKVKQELYDEINLYKLNH